ncbi:MAG: Hsp70 family protein [Euryarchaeota archaeon]|nr:Hsp70 family protein [Euryarchaeota archaeon]
MKVGIDLGTTHCSVAVHDRSTGKTDIIPNGFGKDMTPSVICFLDDGEILIGEDAKDMQAGGAGVIAASFKRSMGDTDFSVEAFGQTYGAERLSSMLLEKLIGDAEERLGGSIGSAVITVPAYFNDFQRKATIRAGEACGIDVLKIINEPTAAAISYGYNRAADKTVMVYDLGGGTFDVTLVKVESGNISVLGTDGNHILGGKDWDSVISKHVCDLFEDEFGVDPREDESAKNELIVAAENYKKVLSKADNVAIQLRYEGNTGKYTLTRDEFEIKTQHLLDATRDVIAELMEGLGIGWEEIDEVLLVGGSSRMPQVAKFLRRMTGKDNVVEHSDTDLAVAKGAAIVAELYASDKTGLTDRKVVDVTAHSLGALTVSIDGKRYINEIMIKKNSKLPAKTRKPFGIGPGNLTDRIEVFTLQGESRDPLECHVLAKMVITGFCNVGSGTTIDIEYTYDENGVVKVNAYQDGEQLEAAAEVLPEDISWMGGSPQDRPSDAVIVKNIAVCVDLSRSMTSCLDDVKGQISDFVNSVADENTNISLIGFGDKVKVVRELTSDPDVIITALDDLKVNMCGRGTDGSPLATAHSVLSSKPGAKMMLVLTDGIWGKRDKAVSESLACRGDGVDIMAIGFAEADLSFLRQIATVEEGAMYTALDRLGDAFSTIATAINTGATGLRQGK